MPEGEYFKGKGAEVRADMIRRYGRKKGERVFHATAEKRGMKPRGYARASTRGGGWRKPRIQEDDPRWNPKTMGNKRGSKRPKKRPGVEPWDYGDPSNYSAMPKGRGNRRA